MVNLTLINFIMLSNRKNSESKITKKNNNYYSNKKLREAVKSNIKMSFERAKVPIMSDAIMYHNEGFLFNHN